MEDLMMIKPGWKTTEVLWPAVLAVALVAAMATDQPADVVQWLIASLGGSSSAYSLSRAVVKRAAVDVAAAEAPHTPPSPPTATPDGWPAAVAAAPPRPS